MCRGSVASSTPPVRAPRSGPLVTVDLTVLIWAFVAVSPLAADLWYQHDQKVEQALERQEWETAVEELNQAIQRRGDSGAGFS